MKVTLTLPSGVKHKAAPPAPDADHAIVEDAACPHCATVPLRVQGAAMRPSADDRAYEADAVAVCCKRPVGLLRAEVSTIFGVREDRAVTEGRCRVY